MAHLKKYLNGTVPIWTNSSSSNDSFTGLMALTWRHWLHVGLTKIFLQPLQRKKIHRDSQAAEAQTNWETNTEWIWPKEPIEILIERQKSLKGLGPMARPTTLTFVVDRWKPNKPIRGICMKGKTERDRDRERGRTNISSERERERVS